MTDLQHDLRPAVPAIVAPIPVTEDGSPRVRAIVGAMSAILDDAGLGIALVAARCVVYSTPLCSSILGRLSALPRGRVTIDHGPVPIFEYFPRAICDAIEGCDGVETERLSLRPSGAAAPVFVEVMPVTSQPHAVIKDLLTVVLYDSADSRPVDVTLLKQTYGLTAAEARVCSLLASGANAQQLAQTLGIAQGTVRIHLKRIYAKTGSKRQAELIRLVLRSAPLRKRSLAAA